MKPPTVKERPAAKDSGAARRGKTIIGNAATASVLHEGAPIPSSIRTRMEQSFGVDLSMVRVHHGSGADSLDAEALVQDGDIHWSATAPALESPEAAPLLAHEIAHVVQQGRAATTEDRVSSPGEPAEIAANVAAGQALAGQTASVAGAGAVAGAQRQKKKDSAAQIDNQAAIEKLTAYLKKVAATTPPQDIKKAKVVRDALKKLAFSGGPMANMLDVDAFVDAPGTSNDPATMATQFAAKFPRITKAALDQLEKAPFIDPQASTTSRVKDLVTGSAAGGPDRPAEPGYVSPEDKANQIGDTLNAMRGTKGPTTYGPGSVDVLQLWRIGKGLKPALTQKPAKAAAPQAEVYPAVTAAIAKMPADALIPAEAKGKSNPDEWAQTTAFAEDLARRMDLAQKSKQTEVAVDLGDNYANVKNRDALRDAVELIIQQLRDALPHHAADVKYVKVKAGGKLLTVGFAATP